MSTITDWLSGLAVLAAVFAAASMVFWFPIGALVLAGIGGAAVVLAITGHLSYKK